VVDVRWVATFPRLVPLEELRRTPGLKKMRLLQKGNRLSITPVTEAEWKVIRKLGGA
jgi:predicted RNA-binding protein with PUA-like domain